MRALRITMALLSFVLAPSLSLAQSPPRKSAGKSAPVTVPAREKPSGDAGPADAEDANALRKAAQNPIANLISVPLQNNINFDVGPYHRPQNVLNFQPVIPIHLTQDWNLITRWITPIIYQPRMSPTDGAEFGLGNLAPAFFLSPAHSGEIIWVLAPKPGCQRRPIRHLASTSGVRGQRPLR